MAPARHPSGSWRGQLLVSLPVLEDGNFRRTVIYMVEHAASAGALGLILNRPSELPAGRPLPAWAPWLGEPGVLFRGGPMALDNAIALGRGWSNGPPSVGFHAVADGVGTVDLNGDADVIGPRLQSLRVFVGHAGWAPGQLEGEVEAGAWLIVAGGAEDVFSEEPERLWRSVLRRQRGMTKAIATMPSDPSRN